LGRSTNCSRGRRIAGSRSAVGFRFSQPEPKPGRYYPLYASTNEQSDSAANRFGEAPDVGFQRARIELHESAIRWKQHSTPNRKPERYGYSGHDPKRVPLRNVAGHGWHAERFEQWIL
jgi:hypothetical protein